MPTKYSDLCCPFLRCRLYSISVAASRRSNSTRQITWNGTVGFLWRMKHTHTHTQSTFSSSQCEVRGEQTLNTVSCQEVCFYFQSKTSHLEGMWSCQCHIWLASYHFRYITCCYTVNYYDGRNEPSFLSWFGLVLCTGMHNRNKCTSCAQEVSIKLKCGYVDLLSHVFQFLCILQLG